MDALIIARVGHDQDVKVLPRALHDADLSHRGAVEEMREELAVKELPAGAPDHVRGAAEDGREPRRAAAARAGLQRAEPSHVAETVPQQGRGVVPEVRHDDVALPSRLRDGPSLAVEKLEDVVFHEEVQSVVGVALVREIADLPAAVAVVDGRAEGRRDEFALLRAQHLGSGLDGAQSRDRRPDVSREQREALHVTREEARAEGAQRGQHGLERVAIELERVDPEAVGSQVAERPAQAAVLAAVHVGAPNEGVRLAGAEPPAGLVVPGDLGGGPGDGLAALV